MIVVNPVIMNDTVMSNDIAEPDTGEVVWSASSDDRITNPFPTGSSACLNYDLTNPDPSGWLRCEYGYGSYNNNLQGTFVSSDSYDFNPGQNQPDYIDISARSCFVRGICTTSSNYYVLGLSTATAGEYKIIKYDDSALPTFVSEFLLDGIKSFVSGICVVDSALAVINNVYGSISILELYDTSGTLLSSGEISTPYTTLNVFFIDLDFDGQFYYMADTTTGRLVKYNKSLEYIDSVITETFSNAVDTPFVPQSVAYDPYADQVLVSNDVLDSSSQVAVKYNKDLIRGDYWLVGEQAIDTTTHNKYEAVTNTIDNPVDGVDLVPPSWVKIGRSNKYTMFDEVIATQSEKDDSIRVSLNTGTPIDSIAGFNVECDKITIDSNNLSSNGLEYTNTFFDVSGEDTNPTGIAWDGEYFWVIGFLSGIVYKYDSNGIYTGTSFSVAGEDIEPRGIAWDGEYLWVVGDDTDAVYRYTKSGVYTGTSFSVASEETSPRGITWDNTHFWVIGLGTDAVYKYDSTGVYTGTSFSVVSEDTAPTGIAWDNTHFWVVGNSTDKIYKYDSAGVYTGTSFDLSGEDIDPAGLTWDGDSLLAVGNDTDAVYKYQYKSYTGESFSVASEDTGPQGIAWDGYHFWVIGDGTDSVYQYDSNGIYTGTSFSVAGEDIEPRGIAWDGEYLWVVGTDTDSAYKYDSSGNYTGTSFSIAGEDDNPQDMTCDGFNFWVVGSGNDAVYKYDSTGVYTGTSFSVVSEDTAPTGISWDGVHFWVTGITNDKVYKYDSSGNYTGESFSVVSEDGLPTGIVWDNTHFWVVGNSTNAVYQYTRKSIVSETIDMSTITKGLRTIDFSNFNLSFDAGDEILISFIYPGNTVKVGELVVGEKFEIGETTFGSGLRLLDYSRVETDEFGTTTVIPRRKAKPVTYSVKIDTDEIPFIFQKLSELTTIPCVWSAEDPHNALTTFGFYADSDIKYTSEIKSDCSVKVTGIT